RVAISCRCSDAVRNTAVGVSSAAQGGFGATRLQPSMPRGRAEYCVTGPVSRLRAALFPAQAEDDSQQSGRGVSGCRDRRFGGSSAASGATVNRAVRRAVSLNRLVGAAAGRARFVTRFRLPGLVIAL